MSSSINMETSASFPTAGVRFSLSLTPLPEGDQAQLSITADELATGNGCLTATRPAQQYTISPGDSRVGWAPKDFEQLATTMR